MVTSSGSFEHPSVRAYFVIAELELGLHCEIGVHCKLPVRSFRTKVIEPSTVTVGEPIKLIFPPAANVAGPVNVKKVTISPGPNELWIVVIGVADAFRPIE